METLLHEMIHAYLFITKKGYDRDGTDGHGKVTFLLAFILIGL